jgi:hypothetical protein
VSLLIVQHACDSKININSFLSHANQFLFFFFFPLNHNLIFNVLLSTLIQKSSALSFACHHSSKTHKGPRCTFNAPAAQATTMVPPQTAVPQPKTSLPFERCHTHHGGQQVQAHARQPPSSNGQHHGETSTPASKPLLRFNRMRCCGVSPHTRWRGS